MGAKTVIASAYHEGTKSHEGQGGFVRQPGVIRYDEVKAF